VYFAVHGFSVNPDPDDRSGDVTLGDTSYLRRLARQALAPLTLVHGVVLGLHSGLKQVLPSSTVALCSQAVADSMSAISPTHTPHTIVAASTVLSAHLIGYTSTTPRMSAQYYFTELLYTLTNCMFCFPSSPQLRINSRSFKMLRLLGEVRCCQKAFSNLPADFQYRVASPTSIWFRIPQHLNFMP